MHDALAGKGVLVTGGASGIGAACAHALAARGARVMIADVEAAKAQQQAAAIVSAGGTASATLVDVADPASVEAMVEHTRDVFGQLSLAVNSAGVAMGRLGTEAEVAELVTFLLSDRAAFITGSSYLVDGGYAAE